MKKLRFILIILATVMFGNLVAQESAVNKTKPELSLTLIPPSPVTDKITLDIRAGVWNNTGLEKKVNVSFYLDNEKASSLLHQQEISVSAGTASCVKFRWPTAGNAGLHKIILVTKSGNQTFRTERNMEIRASTIRSTKQIDGAWINFYHWSEAEGQYWNPAIKTLTDSQWSELMDAQHSIEMNVIVMQEVYKNQMYAGKHTIEKDGYHGLAFYPSELYPGRVPITAVDPVEAVLAAADKDGMNVFMAVGMYAWFDFTVGSLEWHKKLADELWQKYGHHPSFYGWYISEEQDGSLGNEQDRKDIVAFFKGFSDYVHRFAPDKPIMLAPNAHSLRGAEETYRKLLPNLDIICPFAFHRMPEGDLTGEKAAQKLQDLCDEAGSHLWMDMEVFDFFGPDNALVPRPIEGLLSDLHRFPIFEKILCYQYPGLLNSPSMSVKPGGENTVKLFLDYKKYLDSMKAPAKKKNKAAAVKTK